ncbi:replicative DNA helicase [Paenibacillus pseudetheri]|uniref:replicative DNA helicase n=1 Tax=Paenibacillus pseudetheri TaxID=2897682 RepID=UPI001F237EFE|nr:DnaB-like helicase C-terminal domain-containing protein [Paenibacillus pseudetheri]
MTTTLNNYNYLYEAEINVLGAIIKDKSLMEECVLREDSFNPEWNNGLILQVLQNAYKRFADRKDPFYIPDMIKHWGEDLNKIGGGIALIDISRSVPESSASMFKHYMGIVNEAHVQRETERAAREIYSGGSLDDMKSEIVRIEEIQARTSDGGEIVRISDLIKRHTSVIIKRSQNPGGVTGRKSCSNDLNDLTKGHQDGDFIVVGARPSVGKTAYICNEILASTADGSAALLISGEDGDMNILERMIAAASRLELARMKSGKMTNGDWERYGYAAEIIEGREIFIDDTSAPTVESIRRKVAKLIRKFPKLTLYVDYLQHLRSEKSFGSEREMYKYISYELKQIARDFDIPVVCLAALSRKVDERNDKRPVMSDIRDCGNIESDADVVIFLYRDDYYNADSSRKGLMDLIVAKGRNVGTGTVSMVFDKPCQSLLNIDKKIKQKRKDEGLAS